jgi:hypothetical protein
MAAKKKVAAPGLCVQGGPDIHPDVVEFVADPGNRAAVDQFIAREAALQASFEAIAAEIDTSMLVTAVAGGIERRDDLLGPGKRSYGVRASYALKDMTFDANLDYNKTKSFRGADDQSSTKFGLACNATYLKELLGYDDHGITLSVSGAYEKYRDVAGAPNDKRKQLSPLSQSSLRALVDRFVDASAHTSSYGLDDHFQ